MNQFDEHILADNAVESTETMTPVYKKYKTIYNFDILRHGLIIGIICLELVRD